MTTLKRKFVGILLIVFAFTFFYYKSSNSASVSTSGTTSGGTITGYTNEVEGTGTYTGGVETAPVHTKVRYLIKAR